MYASSKQQTFSTKLQAQEASSTNTNNALFTPVKDAANKLNYVVRILSSFLASTLLTKIAYASYYSSKQLQKKVSNIKQNTYKIALRIDKMQKELVQVSKDVLFINLKAMLLCSKKGLTSSLGGKVEQGKGSNKEKRLLDRFNKDNNNKDNKEAAAAQARTITLYLTVFKQQLVVVQANKLSFIPQVDKITILFQYLTYAFSYF